MPHNHRLATTHKVMKNNDNTSSDLEVGMAVGGTAAINSPPRPENPSTMGRLAVPAEVVMAAPKFKNLIKTVQDSVPLRIFRSFNLTKATTQQKALLLLCVAGAILNPLFFYIPMINGDSKCMKSDRKLGVIAISLRSLVDVLHFLLWSFYYEKKWKVGWSKFSASTTAATAASKEISRGNPSSLSPRNSKATGRLIEILCILPLPQAAAVAILIIKGSPRSQQAVTLLKFSVLSQFVLRTFRVFPSFHEATKNSFTLLKSRFWIGAGFNLLLFVIASHVLGAFWYLLSVGRTMDCWKHACRSRVGCNIDTLYCGGPTDNKSYLNDNCRIQQPTNSSAFDFGIYLSAIESNIVGSIRFPLKLSYCFWWGLRNLSSLGQNLTTSAYEWEICFSICISILGLILFSLFIGNMQAYFQYRTNEDLMNMKGKMDKIMKKQRELSNWQPFQWLPQNLKEDVISCVEDNWLETTEVDLQSTLDNLPKDLGKTIKLKIFSELQMKVKLLQALNKRAPNSTIKRVKPEVFTEGSLVFSKDHPIEKMVFILHGKLMKQSGTDGSTAQELRAWDFFGEELLKEIKPGSSSLIGGPLSTADIKTCTKVEAFILNAEDLRSLVVESNYTIEEIMRFIEEPRGIRDAKGSRDTDEDLVRMKDKMDKVINKQKELFKWEPFQGLPRDLQDEIMLCANDSWLETTEVNLRTTLDYLPNDLGKRIKDTIISELQLKVRLLQALNTQALNMFNLVKPEVFAKGSLVFEKGQPIKHMVFVFNGKLREQIGPDGSMAQDLQVWDFCGEELLIEITRSSLKHESMENLPTSTVDIKACTKVEAFILDADDLQTLVNKSNDTIYEIWMSIREHQRAREDAIKKQKKVAEEKPTGLTKSASFKESCTVGGTP